MKRATSRDRLVALLLRVGGALTGSALFAVFLPESWMASVHGSLGLGDFPSAPITSYLTRSLSAMYAMHGVLLFLLSTDVDRYRPVIHWLGWATAVLGLLLLGIDLQAPMPWWWTFFEGPSVLLIGIALCWLTHPGPPPPGSAL
ncbi:MAG: hypothetical protein K8J08_10515 [Thermoanaerobaculia bacterium]|nr:hypothetical protein [Thermoanaerobaculia bacterium]